MFKPRKINIGHRTIWLDENKKFRSIVSLRENKGKNSFITVSEQEPSNRMLFAYMALAYPITFTEWLRKRDCNCFECSESNGPGSQTPCNNECKKNMLKFLIMNYDYNRDIFGINEIALEDMK